MRTGNRKYKDFLKELFLKLTGYQVHSNQWHGLDVFCDLRLAGKIDTINCVLDVGANIGQSAERYLRHFRNATIHCFEPVPETNQMLKKKFEHIPRLIVRDVALGDENGTALMQLNEESEQNSIIDSEAIRCNNAKGHLEVSVKRLCDLIEEIGVNSIDFLKIDTEGNDLKVLQGAEPLLARSAVRFIQVEAGFLPGQEVYVSFQRFFDYLSPYGYKVFGIYEQCVANDSHSLGMANVVFIHDKDIQK